MHDRCCDPSDPHRANRGCRRGRSRPARSPTGLPGAATSSPRSAATRLGRGRAWSYRSPTSSICPREPMTSVHCCAPSCPPPSPRSTAGTGSADAAPSSGGRARRRPRAHAFVETLREDGVLVGRTGPDRTVVKIRPRWCSIPPTPSSCSRPPQRPPAASAEHHRTSPAVGLRSIMTHETCLLPPADSSPRVRDDIHGWARYEPTGDVVMTRR